MEKRTLTLYELNALVRTTIEQCLDCEYWVEAELSECRESRGHCFMELIQKDERSNTPAARAQAKCWQSTWKMLAPYFERTTGQALHAGLKARLKVYAQFHEAYGFSWIVTDIDPTYTMGDMARRRHEIIRQLKAEGVFDLQKDLRLPALALRIAVISSQTAAGYGDFVNQLADSPYPFQTQLFAAIMQGEQVEESVVGALDRIFSMVDCFDAVVIIRGGGATADLSGFDTLRLAENVAQFPLPVITGIGHDRDESILDMVSHTRVKTPTAAAQLLISHLDTTQQHIDQCRERLIRYVQAKIETEHLRLTRLSERIPALFTIVKSRQEARLGQIQQIIIACLQRRIDRERARLDNVAVKLRPLTSGVLQKEHHRLELLNQRTKSLDPALLLKRGYSITLHNGKAVRDPSQLKSGDLLETRLEQGIIHSKMISDN